MTDTPPAPERPDPGPWQVFLTDESGFVLTDAVEALDELGPESVVSISIRRGEALPIGERLPGSWPPDDVVFDVEMDLVDEDGSTGPVEQKLAQARAMAAGLNRAAANPGDWNRGTDLAASLHDLADKLAAYDGPLPSFIELDFGFLGGIKGQDVGTVDQLATALIGRTGEPTKASGPWTHEVKAELPGGLTAQIYTYIPAPAEEDPAALRAEIDRLKAQLAEGGEQA